MQRATGLLTRLWFVFLRITFVFTGITPVFTGITLGFAGNSFAGDIRQSQVAVNDSAAVTGWQHWPAVGKANLRWFIFHVYTSELRSENGRFYENKQPVVQNLALQITYHRDIDAKDLLAATQEQWLHLGYNKADIGLWSQVLSDIFPSVSEGDELSFVIENQQGTFYYRKSSQADWQLLGAIHEPSFSDAFLSIWLSPATEYPQLRQQLIGGLHEHDMG
ncbi:chalcone isomerase family protein [Vibrio aerogenes]|nr:chalcone isomerase family protein [Vibrio aerogenes]